MSDQCGSDPGGIQHIGEDMAAELAALRGEVARLTSALQWIAGITIYPDDAHIIPAAMSHMKAASAAHNMRETARAALGASQMEET